MTTWEQAKANVVDSPITTYIGMAIVALKILCDSGALASLLGADKAAPICTAVGNLAAYIAGPALMVSRSPNTPPR